MFSFALNFFFPLVLSLQNWNDTDYLRLKVFRFSFVYRPFYCIRFLPRLLLIVRFYPSFQSIPSFRPLCPLPLPGQSCRVMSSPGLVQGERPGLTPSCPTFGMTFDAFLNFSICVGPPPRPISSFENWDGNLALRIKCDNFYVKHLALASYSVNIQEILITVIIAIISCALLFSNLRILTDTNIGMAKDMGGLSENGAELKHGWCF